MFTRKKQFRPLLGTWLKWMAPVALATVAAGCGGGEGDLEPVCSDVAINVDAGKIYGQWCRPVNLLKPKVLQVLVHGGSYDHTYWNFPGFNKRYSYSDYMNRAGYATLAIDQLGVGKSTHPPSTEVTYSASTKAVAQVVASVKAGSLGKSYSQVVLVGHSIGSLLSLGAQASYGSADGVLLSGFTHTLGLGLFERLGAKVVPALQDPVVMVKNAIPAGDLGYVSIVGGRSAFYDAGDADPALVTADENSRSEQSGALNAFEALTVNVSSIKVPVLIANGVLDVAFCAQGKAGATTDCSSAATLKTAEQAFFTSASPLDTYVLPGAGHNLNLTLQAQTWYGGALNWFQSRYPVN